jgi:hypothetical protein
MSEYEADWDSAHDYAQRVSDQFLECRVRRHNWRSMTAKRDEFGNYDVTEECTTCGSQCYYMLNRRGVIIKTRVYQHSPGYLMDKGEGRIAGEAFGALRIELLERQLPGGQQRPQPRKGRRRKTA